MECLAFYLSCAYLQVGWGRDEGILVKARVTGPQEVAGTLHSETPWVLGGGKGTNRQISIRGFEDPTWFPKTPKPSLSVAARRLEMVPIFC